GLQPLHDLVDDAPATAAAWTRDGDERSAASTESIDRRARIDAAVRPTSGQPPSRRGGDGARVRERFLEIGEALDDRARRGDATIGIRIEEHLEQATQRERERAADVERI